MSRRSGSLRRGGLAAYGLAAGLATGALSACGCHDAGPPNPVPIPALEPDDAGAGGAGGSTPLPDAGVPRRTIEQRSLFGGPAGNLLVDGDFEFSATYSGWDQTGWRAFALPSWDSIALGTETGGLCKTGLRCGVIEDDQLLLGEGTSPIHAGMKVSFAVRPPAGQNCHVVLIALYTCATGAGMVELAPIDPEPAADGWCTLEASLLERDLATCVYIETALLEGQRALVDSGRMLPDDGTAPLVSRGRPVATERAARIARAAEELKRRRVFGSPGLLQPPSPRP